MPGGSVGLQVLQGMHGEIDAAVVQRLMDLLGEQPLAADIGEAAVLHRIAGGADRVFLEHVEVAQHRAEGAQHGEERLRLHERQRARARADTQRQQAAMRRDGRRLGEAHDLTLEHDPSPRKDTMATLAGPVLGIETSCDETAAAVLAPDGRVLAETLLSQQEHAPYGGVVPEIAARAHLAHLPRLANDVMRAAGIGYAATGRRGGDRRAGADRRADRRQRCSRKGIALAHGAPYVAVNHLEAHALTARLPGLSPDGRAFPYLLLLVSGGHCQLVAVEGVGRHRRLGGTIDDAVGEAFDKVGKLLGLGWPGGPALERLAAEGDARRFALPRPMLGRPGCDFSFSGLKTAVRTRLAAAHPAGAGRPRGGISGAVADVLGDRAAHAMAAFAATHAGGTLVVAGGVAANAGGAPRRWRRRRTRMASACSPRRRGSAPTTPSWWHGPGSSGCASA